MYLKLALSVVTLICVISNVYSYSVYNLNSENSKVIWSLDNKNGSIQIRGSVPGGVYTDLQREGIIDDIFKGFNDVLTRWVAYDNWTYSAKFHVPKHLLKKRVIHLVFEGVDTIAFVEVNGSPVGSTQNMFVRYVFDVREHLQEGLNELKVSFDSPVTAAKQRSQKFFTPPACVPDIYHGECHANQLRKMQASFSWDWGPAFPSVGLWRPVYLEFYAGAILRYVATHITNSEGLWNLKIDCYIESAKKVSNINGYLQAVLTVTNVETIKVGKTVNIRTGMDGTAYADVDMTISENIISTWWPNGYGDQPLYALNVSFLSNDFPEEEPTFKNVNIGFRTLELVEKNASMILGNSTGGDGLTFYFRINGYPLFMKGSNVIPTHILPEKAADKRRIDNLLEAAQDTHMSMLRVWGGGIYESDYFYQKCDELGLLVWQDFLFACSMYPADDEFLRSVKTEVEQNVIRLQHHPSIAVWAGNNENEGALRDNWYNTKHDFEKYKYEYIKLYVDTIKPIVETLDPGRRYLVSSPSNGIESESEGYIAQQPSDPRYGDTHYYNYLVDTWDLNVYPTTRFASEYGFQSLPSLATMRTATNDSEDFNVTSLYSDHRQHSPSGYDSIENLFKRHLKLDLSHPNYFENFVYYSQISQAMAVKAETEFYRQSQSTWYTMGALYWQLNDVWQAPSWSSIEYTGRWKMLQYFAKSFFAPVLVSPRLLETGDIDVYLINDRFVPILRGEIIVDIFNWDNLEAINTTRYSARVGPLMAKKQDIDLGTWRSKDKNKIFYRFSLKAEGVSWVPYNYVFPTSLKSIVGLKHPNIKITISDGIQNPRYKKAYSLNIEVDTVVLMLWLESDDPDGRFEDNGLVVTSPNITVNYLTNSQISPSQLQKWVTYKYYMN